MSAEKDRRGSRRSIDSARVVVAVVAAGVLLSVVSFILPSGDGKAPGAGPASAAEGRVFEGKKYKYRLRTPPGAPWRVTPPMLLPPQAAEADLAIDRPGAEAIVMVSANEVTRTVPMDAVIEKIAAAQSEGGDLQVLERTPITKGDDRGLFVRAKRAGGRKSVEMFLLIISRDDVLYVVTGAAPSPAPEQLTTQMSALIQSFEPPPPEPLDQPPAPPLSIAEPPASKPGGAAQESEYDLARADARAGNIDAALFRLQKAALAPGVDADRAEEEADLGEARKDPRWPALRTFLRRAQRYRAKHAAEPPTLKGR